MNAQRDAQMTVRDGEIALAELAPVIPIGQGHPTVVVEVPLIPARLASMERIIAPLEPAIQFASITIVPWLV